MHEAAHEWVGRYRTNDPVRVLDIGGRDINGTLRDLFPNASYTCLDLRDGPGVDVVADAATWAPEDSYDIVVCAEVFEHTEKWPQICATAFDATDEWFIVTAAGPGRGEHSGIDGCGLKPDEWYENIDPMGLRTVLLRCGFKTVEVNIQGLDVRAAARK